MEIYERIKRNKRNVRPKELIELLIFFGHRYRNTKGDHEIYKRVGGRPFPVPIRQNPISIDIVQEALRAIEEIIVDEEF